MDKTKKMSDFKFLKTHDGKDCSQCKAYLWNNNSCDLGFAIKDKFTPIENCPYPRTTKRFFKLLSDKKLSV
jgi:hypothetical protein